MLLPNPLLITIEVLLFVWIPSVNLGKKPWSGATKLKVLSKEEIEIIYNATTNIRDKFLIKLLFETGLRIGEALSHYHV